MTGLLKGSNHTCHVLFIFRTFSASKPGVLFKPLSLPAFRAKLPHMTEWWCSHNCHIQTYFPTEVRVRLASIILFCDLNISATYFFNITEIQFLRIPQCTLKYILKIILNIFLSFLFIKSINTYMHVHSAFRFQDTIFRSFFCHFLAPLCS